MQPVSRSIPPSPIHKAIRHAAMLSLAVALVFTTGCFGLTPLTRATYKFNKEASENEFVQSVMFWFLSPVYALGIIGDVLVLNPVEFWSGQTLDLGVSQATAPEAQYEVSKATNAMLRVPADSSLVLRAVDGGYEIREIENGRLAGTIHPALSGGVALYDAAGVLVKEFPRVS